jgi:hypothetical protein
MSATDDSGAAADDDVLTVDQASKFLRLGRNAVYDAIYAKQFLEGYLPDQKPSERRSKQQILDGHLVPAFGHLALDQIRQSDVDGWVAKELRRVTRKTINNRLAVLSSLLKYAHENKLIERPTIRCHLKRKRAEKDAPVIAVPGDDVRSW